jgi:hypothetical protein
MTPQEHREQAGSDHARRSRSVDPGFIELCNTIPPEPIGSLIINARSRIQCSSECR